MQNKPAKMTITSDAIPPELTAKNKWVLWSWQWRGDKWTKPLLQVSGKYVSSTDPRKWCSYTQAFTAYKMGRFDGVGYVFTANNPYVGVDWDDCRNRTPRRSATGHDGSHQGIGYLHRGKPIGVWIQVHLLRKIAGWWSP